MNRSSEGSFTGPVITMLFVLAAFLVGLYIGRMLPARPSAAPAPTATLESDQVAQAPTTTRSPVPTVPAARTPTALATLTPSQTLRPPPTLEPPTATILPSSTPSPSLTPTLDLSVSIPGLQDGSNLAAKPSPEGCQPRADWKLIYVVKRGDALARIADLYNTSVAELVKANCMADPNVLVAGRQLRVPGKAHPTVPAVVCEPWELLTPFDNTLNVAAGGNLSFVWRGPRAPKFLIRVTKPDNTIWEGIVELRQNEMIDAGKEFNPGGNYTWQVFPLDVNFVQVCPESPKWRFTKAVGPTFTPTPPATSTPRP